AEQVAQALGVAGIDIQVLQAARARARLQRDEIVEHAARRLHDDAIADPAIAVRARWTRAELHPLATVSRRVDVRDVLARHIARTLKRHQPGQARAEKIRHTNSAS